MSIEGQEFNYVLDIIKEIQYGLVTITVHDGKITQVDSTKKERFKTQKNGINYRNENKPSIYR